MVLLTPKHPNTNSDFGRSVLSAGWNDPINAPPMSGRYVAFSIEELLTIEFNDLDSVDD